MVLLPGCLIRNSVIDYPRWGGSGFKGVYEQAEPLERLEYREVIFTGMLLIYLFLSVKVTMMTPFPPKLI